VLTELISKIIMTFEHFDQVIQHAKINRYLGQDFFNEISFLSGGDMEMRRVLI
jgi:hypothetical protein